MSQIYCYMFEAKSIQSYIFRTGKLRDVIATSERLDQLIDTNDNSVLSKILKLLPNSKIIKDKDKNIDSFIRRKGGAFYVYSENIEILQALRKTWTLTVQQLFPQMDFIDGIAMGKNLVEAINNTHEKLSESRNNPTIKVPLFRANMALATRTAKAATDYDKSLEEYIDVDTNINRHTYQLMKKDRKDKNYYKQYLYKKFIDQSNLDEIYANTNNNPSNIFPLDLNPEDKIDEDEISKSNKDSINKFPYINNNHDLALIHIDGNGIGILLKKLKDQLKQANQEDYKGIFRGFSDVLCASTEAAAKYATKKLINKVSSENNSNLPMRPLVMGGDDITLLCRSDLALYYANDFCLKFQEETGTRLADLFNQEQYKKLNLQSMPDCLTASGGIVFQKATQPFTAAHHLVEELCKQAKNTSKKNTSDGTQEGTGAPALAFMRIATVQDDNYQRLFEDGYQIKIDNKILKTSIGNYIVSKEDSKETYNNPKLNDLIQLIEKLTHKDSPLLISLFRKVLTQLHHGNLDEAENLINRAEKISQDSSIEIKEKLNAEIKEKFKAIKGNKTGEWWLWNDKGNQQTILADITTLAKFKGGKSND